MIRLFVLPIILSFALALPARGGTVAEPCWRKVCTGMTMSEVTRELRSQGFEFNFHRLQQLFRRLFPLLSGGSMDFERYGVHISARNDDTEVSLSFVRFPSGRKRLYHLSSTQTFESTQTPVPEALELLNSAVSVDGEIIGPPDTAKWEEWPANLYDKQDRSLLVVAWNYGGGRPSFGPPGIGGRILTEQAAALDGDALKVPDEIDQLFAKSATVIFTALTAVALEAPAAWKAEKAGWIADSKSGCRVWNNVPQGDDERMVWNGECGSDGRATGHGVVTWFDEYGFQYETDEGTFLKGKLNGTATIKLGFDYQEKTTFTGEFRDNLPNGYGILSREGQAFAGEWVDGCLRVGGHSVAFFTHRDACSPF